MRYDLIKRILSRRCSDDIRALIHYYSIEHEHSTRLFNKIQDLEDKLTILEAENKILKEEANKHDY